MLKLISLVFLLSLVGCAAVPDKSPVLPAGSVKGTSDPIENAKVGDVIELENGVYTVVNSYVAASGRRCKLLLHKISGESPVACQSDSRDWYVRKPLTKYSSPVSVGSVDTGSINTGSINTGVVETSQVDLPDPGTASVPNISPGSSLVQIPDVRLDAGSVDSGRMVAVQADENLWRFSRRVTGNATNWDKIARFNNLENVSIIRAGDKLDIPPDLALLQDGS